MIKGILINPYDKSFEHTYLSSKLEDKEISILCNCERFAKRSFVYSNYGTHDDIDHKPVIYLDAVGFGKKNQRYFKIYHRLFAGTCLILRDTTEGGGSSTTLSLEKVEELVTWVDHSFIEGNELC